MAVGKKPKIHKRLLGNWPELSKAISRVLVSHMKKNSEVSHNVEMGQIIVPSICNSEFVFKVNLILNSHFTLFIF